MQYHGQSLVGWLDISLVYRQIALLLVPSANFSDARNMLITASHLHTHWLPCGEIQLCDLNPNFQFWFTEFHKLFHTNSDHWFVG